MIAKLSALLCVLIKSATVCEALISVTESRKLLGAQFTWKIIMSELTLLGFEPAVSAKSGP